MWWSNYPEGGAVLIKKSARYIIYKESVNGLQEINQWEREC